MPRITDTVKHLLIINVLVYFATLLLLGEGVRNAETFWELGRYGFALFFPTSEHFYPIQIISHMFMHANEMHLLFNMFGVYMFGTALESYLGAKKFLFYYLATAMGAMLLYLLIQYLGAMNAPDGLASIENIPMLGASGALFGLLAGFGMLFPNNVIQLLFPPIALKAKYFVLIYAGIELFLGVSGMNTGIAHFAHLGGALFGVLIILYWRKTDNRWQK